MHTPTHPHLHTRTLSLFHLFERAPTLSWAHMRGKALTSIAFPHPTPNPVPPLSMVPHPASEPMVHFGAEENRKTNEKKEDSLQSVWNLRWCKTQQQQNPATTKKTVLFFKRGFYFQFSFCFFVGCWTWKDLRKPVWNLFSLKKMETRLVKFRWNEFVLSKFCEKNCLFETKRPDSEWKKQTWATNRTFDSTKYFIFARLTPSPKKILHSPRFAKRRRRRVQLPLLPSDPDWIQWREKVSCCNSVERTGVAHKTICI